MSEINWNYKHIDGFFSSSGEDFKESNKHIEKHQVED